MEQMTYGKLSQIIRDTYYKGIPNDESAYSLRYFAELIAGEVAVLARQDAFENSNAGESTFANDQFISTYRNLPLLEDALTKEKYVTLPATPAALPNNQEIAFVSFTGCPKRQIVPMRNKDRFAQGLIGDPKVVDLCYVQDGRLYFEYISPLSTGNVNLSLVGAVPQGEKFLELPLNVPKNVETEIKDRIIAKLRPATAIVQDKINDGNSQ